MEIKSYKRTVDVDIYETSDGRTFHFENDAKHHETTLWEIEVRKHLVRMIVEHPFEQILSRHWTMIRNENELKYFIEKIGNPYYVNDRYYLNDRGLGAREILSVGDWIAETYNDEGDSSGYWTLSFLRDEFLRLLSETDEITVDGKY